MEKPLIFFLIAFGFINCFFGYRLFKALLPIWGAFIGFILGYTIIEDLVSNHILATGAGGVAGGIMGSLLFTSIYFFGVFAIGALFAITLTKTALVPVQAELKFLISLGAGLVGGLLALLAQKIVIIMSTAFTGATALLSAVFAFRGYEPVTDYFSDPSVLDDLYLPGLIGTIALALVGILVQFMVTANLWTKKDSC